MAAVRFKPRYSLRALFVAVTLLALWLGWEVHIVQMRKDSWTRILAAGGEITWEDLFEDEHPDPGPWIPRVPWYRRLLGDRAARTILIVPSDPSNHDQTNAELAAVKSGFPEAGVTGINRDGSLVDWLCL